MASNALGTIFFCSLIAQNIGILSRAFRQQFIIPDFQNFVRDIEEMYWKCKSNTDGKVRMRWVWDLRFQMVLF